MLDWNETKHVMALHRAIFPNACSRLSGKWYQITEHFVKIFCLTAFLFPNGTVVIDTGPQMHVKFTV